jgi:carbonyl reductase 1
MAPHDRILLTGRDPARVQAAAATAAGQALARVEGRVLGVRDRDAIAALAAELGEVDIVFANAAARMQPEADPADEVDAVAETNNLATTRLLRAFAPRLRRGCRLIVVASTPGTLDKLDDRVSGRFAAASASLDAVDAVVAEWRQAVHDGRAEDAGYGAWLNLPSKVAQVVAVRAVARERRAVDLAEGKLIMALCPGLIDTDASRPWFADMSAAQTRPTPPAGPSSSPSPTRSTPATTASSSNSGRCSPGRRASRWRTRRPPDIATSRVTASSLRAGPDVAHVRSAHEGLRLPGRPCAVAVQRPTRASGRSWRRRPP